MFPFNLIYKLKRPSNICDLFNFILLKSVRCSFQLYLFCCLELIQKVLEIKMRSLLLYCFLYTLLPPFLPFHSSIIRLKYVYILLNL